MRVSYLDAAILDLNRTPLPQCEGIDGFDCCDPAIVFNVDARQYFCGPHHRFWEKHYQSHDPYEFGTFDKEIGITWRRRNLGESAANPGASNLKPNSAVAPQTLVERVCEYMQKQGM